MLFLFVVKLGYDKGTIREKKMVPNLCEKSSLQLKETIDLVLSNPSFEEFRVQFTTMVNFQILSEKLKIFLFLFLKREPNL